MKKKWFLVPTLILLVPLTVSPMLTSCGGGGTSSSTVEGGFVSYPKVKTNLHTKTNETVKDWISNENGKSVEKKLDDLFSKHDGLTEESVSSVQLKRIDDSSQGNAAITVSLKGLHLFKSDQGNLEISKTFNAQINRVLSFDISPEVYESVAKNYIGITFNSNENLEETKNVFNFFFNPNRLNYLVDKIASIKVEKGSTDTDVSVEISLKTGTVFPDGKTSDTFHTTLSKTHIGSVPLQKAIVLVKNVDNYTREGVIYTQPKQIEEVLVAFFNNPSTYLKDQIASIQVSKVGKDEKTTVTITLKQGLTFDDGSSTLVREVTLLREVIAPSIMSSVVKKDVETYINKTFTEKHEFSTVLPLFFGLLEEDIINVIKSAHIYQKEDDKINIYLDLTLTDGYILDEFGEVSHTYKTELTESPKQNDPTSRDIIDVKQQTVDAWIRDEQAKDLSQQINDLFEPQEFLSATNVKSIAYNNEVYKVAITVTLNDGFVFKNGQTSKSWQLKLTNVTVGKPVERTSIDAENQLVFDWIYNEKQKFLNEQLDDLFVYRSLLSIDNVDSINYSIGSDNQHISVVINLKDQFSFDDGTKQKTWTLTLNNLSNSVGSPSAKKTIEISYQSIDSWIPIEKSKSLDQQLDDLFVDRAGLSSSTVKSVDFNKCKTESNKIRITITLLQGFVFDSSVTGNWELTWIPGRTQVLDTPIAQKLINVGNKTIENWIAIEEKLWTAKSHDENVFKDLFTDKKGLTQTTVTYIFYSKVISGDNELIKVQIVLAENYSFNDGLQTKEWTFPVENALKSVPTPVSKKLIYAAEFKTADDWISNEKKKTLAEKIKDVFGDSGAQLSEKNVASISLTRKNAISVEVNVVLKEGFAFDNDSLGKKEFELTLTDLMTTALHKPVAKKSVWSGLVSPYIGQRYINPKDIENIKNVLKAFFDGDQTSLANKIEMIDIFTKKDDVQHVYLEIFLKSEFVFFDASEPQATFSLNLIAETPQPQPKQSVVRKDIEKYIGQRYLNPKDIENIKNVLKAFFEDDQDYETALASEIEMIDIFTKKDDVQHVYLEIYLKEKFSFAGHKKVVTFSINLIAETPQPQPKQSVVRKDIEKYIGQRYLNPKDIENIKNVLKAFFDGDQTSLVNKIEMIDIFTKKDDVQHVYLEIFLKKNFVFTGDHKQVAEFRIAF